MQVVVLASSASGDAVASPQIPAPLVMVEGRPRVDWQLDSFVASGVRNVVMCVGYLGEQIETHVRRALDRGLVVSYSYEGEAAVGTGGALRRALARLESEFVLTFGDHYQAFDYAAPLTDLRSHPEALGSMSVRKHRGDGSGRVALEGDWVARYENNENDPSLDHVEAGAVALRRSILNEIEDGAVWGIEALLRKLARKRQLRALLAPAL